MRNYLDTGGVLPSGLLTGDDTMSRISAFNKTYCNYPLRAGIVTEIFPFDDPNNFTKLSTEYTVQVFEQAQDVGNTIITYKNVIAADSFGNIADFLEFNYREKTTNNEGNLDSTDQNGSIVLLLCLDGVSEKAVIVGALTHPNRQTTLLNDEPYLEGEYNGVNIKVNTDGSTSLIFNGATDSEGVPLDDTQGITTVQIEKDGTFQVDHSEITLRLDRTNKEILMSSMGNWTVNIQGNTSINTQGDTDITTQGNTSINTTKDTNITTSGNSNVSTTGNTSVTTQGTTTVNSTGDTTIQSDGNINVTATGNAVITAAIIELNGQTGDVLTTATEMVVDTIFGTPTVGVPTVKAG